MPPMLAISPAERRLGPQTCDQILSCDGWSALQQADEGELVVGWLVVLNMGQPTHVRLHAHDNHWHSWK